MSLLHIHLKDFVIVKHLDLDLETGFTALTGETGAGKSILIDALQFALGGRADKGVIRPGQSKAEVSVGFHPTQAVETWLEQEGFESDETSLLIRRVIDNQSRSRGWINGASATASQMRGLGEFLLDIHGQHAWQALMKPEATRALLDGYGCIPSQALQPLWADWKAAETALQQAQTTQAHQEHRQEQLRWQLGELDKLAPGAQEWESLQAEHTLLANVHELIESSTHAAEHLEDGDHNALELLLKARQALASRMSIEPVFEALIQNLDQAVALIEDTARDLHGYIRRMEADPERLSFLDQRISRWLSLAKSHHCSPQDLPARFEQLRRELDELATAGDLERLQSQAETSRRIFLEKSEEISALRHVHKENFAIDVATLIQQLGMKGGAFEVKLTPLDEPQSFGLEAVEFLVAGHSGAPLRPVAKVASGGELSRISLAIAVTTSQLGGCPTVIFDEVDSGIGGAVAHTVGQLMAQLGDSRQVLAVTHLPQVAACAHHHLLVKKTESDGEVSSQVTSLSAIERVQEVARMLGGSTITDTTLAHAQELLGT